MFERRPGVLFCSRSALKVSVMAKIKWQHPNKRGETVRHRLERLWQYISFYDQHPPVTPGQHIQLSRYLSEIQFLEQQGSGK